jgi:protein-S-isoprenylcysteine O-methyltransferase Ste14
VQKDRPGVIAPPPLIYLAVFIVAYLCRDLLPRWGSRTAGAVLAAIGVTIMAWAFATMLRARTNIDPYKPATALVSAGPYRFSRNPIYVGMTVLYIAAAVSFRIFSALIVLPIALIILEFGVIRREERYLDAKFGERYREYRSRVRRWA